MTREKDNSAQRKQRELEARVIMKRNLSTSFLLEYVQKLHLHNSKKNHPYNKFRQNLFRLDLPCQASVGVKVRFETCIQKLQKLWALVISRLCFEDSVMNVAHIFEKLGNFCAFMH